ncbi:MAG: hypothetical protein E7013_06540 [Alphaproteobacteria bacterium]|nr:hypothetical protein [Alphaproteobacteria bacterium]
MQEFQKQSHLWNYVSGSSYNMDLLKDFGFLDAEQYKWFCLFVCRNKNIAPVKENLKMSLSDFKRREFFLLNQPSLFDLLERMLLPLQIKKFQLGLDLEDGFYNNRITCRKLSDFFKSDTFSNDCCVRWNYYFKMVAQTINDLRTCFALEFDMPEFKKAREQEKKNLVHATMLEKEFKQALSGVPEYIWENDVIWSASDNQVVPLFLKFSSLFDFSDEKLSEMVALQSEENMLKVVEKAIILCETNDLKGKENAFSDILTAQEKVAELKGQLKLKHLHHHLNQIWKERQERGFSNEKE